MVRVCTMLYVYDRIENSHNLHRKQLSRLLCNIERIICFTFMVFNLGQFEHLTICSKIPFSERIHNNTMNDKNTYSVDKYLEIIAEKKESQKKKSNRELGRAVSIALKSPDPQMQRFWTDFPCDNETPTIEEIIYHLAEKFAKSHRQRTG